LTSLPDRLSEDRRLLLDGALGTELERRGIPMPPHLWSAGALLSHPDAVRRIHTDFLEAGAEWITANTFRTHRRNLTKAGLGDRAAELTKRAVELAREAAETFEGQVQVAGSLAPLEDCYRPEDVPSEADLKAEHNEMTRNLSGAGADLILVETQNTIREASAATRAAAETGLPTAVSFICGRDGRLLSGETLTAAVTAVLPFGPIAVLVNCLPGSAVAGALQELKQTAGETPIGVYANTGEFDPAKGWGSTPLEQAENYARAAKDWWESGAKILGGCCGTTPEHIRKLHDVLSE